MRVNLTIEGATSRFRCSPANIDYLFGTCRCVRNFWRMHCGVGSSGRDGGRGGMREVTTFE